jgi:monoamine oxidase
VQGRHGLRVESRRLTVRAERAIVAIPPTLAGRIDYTPHLNAARDHLMQEIPQGTLLKVNVVYDRPFWRDKGLNGTTVSLNGPVNAAFDDSAPDGSPGALLGFIGGDEARTHLSKTRAQRKAAVLKNLVDYYGAEAAHPREYLETNWPAAKWSRGGPVGVCGPGVLTAHGHALREPAGFIHWAGTETSTYWNGYMDGAVRSGERAAREILDEL